MHCVRRGLLTDVPTASVGRPLANEYPHVGRGLLTDVIKPAILQTLDDGDENVRRQAIRALKDLATEDDLDCLIPFIREATWENGRMTVEVLEALGEPGHKALKKLALSEPVIPAAAYYLASQGDARGGDILAELLTSQDAQKQKAAMALLAELHDPRCVPYLD